MTLKLRLLGQNASTRSAGAARPPEFLSKYGAAQFESALISFPSVEVLVSTQDQGPFPHRSIWKMVEKKSGTVLPALQ